MGAAAVSAVAGPIRQEAPAQMHPAAGETIDMLREEIGMLRGENGMLREKNGMLCEKNGMLQTGGKRAPVTGEHCRQPGKRQDRVGGS